MAFIVMASMLACDDEDTKLPTENPRDVLGLIKANFVTDKVSIKENEENLVIQVKLSSKVETASTIRVAVDNNVSTAFVTTPAFQNDGWLNLVVPAGENEVSFSVQPRDNDKIKGHEVFRFDIISVTGGISAGDKSTTTMTILDDELIGRAKSYQSVGGGWKSKKVYEYDEAGRLSKVHWETETPGKRTGTDVYYYAANGLIERIKHYEGHDEYFISENGKIVRSEYIKYGVKTSYAEYEYDGMGNVAGKAEYVLQPDGQYKNSLIFIYFYFYSGDLYKQLVYYPTVDNDLELISTRTYASYLDKLNPFPVMEIIPTISAQRHLPASYREEGNGSDLSYEFSYEFNEAGSVTRRITNGEYTEYLYY